MAVKTNYQKNGSSYYRVTATIGKDPDGKPIRKEFYGKSKKEAEQKRDEYLRGRNANTKKKQKCSKLPYLLCFKKNTRIEFLLQIKLLWEKCGKLITSNTCCSQTPHTPLPYR